MSTVPLNKLEMLALSVTRGVGSVASVIIHTFLFTGAFVLVFLGFDFDRVLLVLTTIVSLEAIYLSIFIQLSVNYQARAIASVEKDIDEIQEDVEEIAEDVGEIAEDVEEIQEAHEEIQEDIEEIQKDVEDIQEAHEEIAEDIEEIQKDVDEIQEDVEDIQEEKAEESKKV
jgi:peptidoglycan hydrolase CwlO-like protein